MRRGSTKKTRGSSPATVRGVTFADALELAHALPGVEDGSAYGTPALRVRGKFWLRLREDGETLAVKIPFDDREVLLRADPAAFFLTDHYLGYPAVLIRLAKVRRGQLADVLERSWRAVAPRRLVAELDARRS